MVVAGEACTALLSLAAAYPGAGAKTRPSKGGTASKVRRATVHAAWRSFARNEGSRSAQHASPGAAGAMLKTRTLKSFL